MNDAIRVREIRLIDFEGENHGIVQIEDAIKRAADAGLDLVEVSPDAEPPVCKILDYGKYKYQEQKKAAEARKKQKTESQSTGKEEASDTSSDRGDADDSKMSEIDTTDGKIFILLHILRPA